MMVQIEQNIVIIADTGQTNCNGILYTHQHVWVILIWGVAFYIINHQIPTAEVEKYKWVVLNPLFWLRLIDNIFPLISLG